jgi:beta-1,2-mannobiose phosphorylase / 1,2-beta-oligomannan phosphorylase
VECVLNPGAFRFEGKTWLLLRVAERPLQKEGMVSFPVMNGRRAIPGHGV